MNRKIFLKSGSSIEFGNNIVLIYDQQKGLSSVGANTAAAKILSKLIDAKGQPVSHQKLYDETRDVHGKDTQKPPNQTISNEINKLRKLISEDIITEHGVGYKILLAEEAKQNYRTQGEFDDLIGEYYGFYLDPAVRDAKGKLLTAFIRIYRSNRQEANLAVNAVLGLQCTDMLTEVTRAFSGKNDFSSQFDTFYSKLPRSNRGCFFVNGDIKDCGQHIVAMSMQQRSKNNESIAHWNIILNMRNYMFDERPRKNDDELYRGGLAMMLGGFTTFGIIAHQIALIRVPTAKDNLKVLDIEDVAAYLYTTNHLRVNIESDKAFYNNLLFRQWPITLDHPQETEQSR